MYGYLLSDIGVHREDDNRKFVEGKLSVLN